MTEAICKHWIAKFGAPEILENRGGITKAEEEEMNTLFKIDNMMIITHGFRRKNFYEEEHCTVEIK